MAEKNHYTVVIQVTKTTLTEKPQSSRGEKEVEREVQDIANFAIRSGTIASSIVKAQKHLELLED